MSSPELQARILAVLESHPGGMNPKAIIAALDSGETRNVFARALHRLVELREVRNIGESKGKPLYAIADDSGASLGRAMNQWHPPHPPSESDHSPQ